MYPQQIEITGRVSWCLGLEAVVSQEWLFVQNVFQLSAKLELHLNQKLYTAQH